MSAAHAKDGYKIAHGPQYPKGITEMYSNLTARSGNHSNIEGSKGIYFVGAQYMVADFLIEEWNNTFFNRPRKKVVNKYQRRVSNLLGYEVDVQHIEDLHKLGHLPVRIKALPEGSFVPYGVPCMTIKNTDPRFPWIVGALETSISCEMWLACTSATTYMAYKKIFLDYAKETCDNTDHVPFQGHDFSMRGMSGRHTAAISSFATLACGSKGTDCIPAIDLAEDYYGADSDREVIALTIPGTEHSVMCAGGKEKELQTKIRLITQVHPTGPVGIVWDTWDFWGGIRDHLPILKPYILARDGSVVIRPDSGDPVDIITGLYNKDGFTTKYIDDTVGVWVRNNNNNTSKMVSREEANGLIHCLWEQFGGTINSKGYKVLNPKIGAIYGDSITPSRAEEILSRLKEQGFASSNIIFGIGSYTYQFVTRDTHGFAVKGTNVIINGKSTPIFKDPITDNGVKKSAVGYLCVISSNGEYILVENCGKGQEKQGALRTIFCNSKAYNETTLSEIRFRTDHG